MLNSLIFNLIERFSFIRKYKIFKFTKDIGFPLILKIISRFFRDDIDDNLIILGAYSGRLYIESPKYLFEFLTEKSNYKVVWITKNNDTLSELKEKRYNVAPYYSIKTIQLLRKAKYIFLSHGHLDVPPIEFSSKTQIILAWHGTPIKRIALDSEKTYAYGKWNRVFKLKLEFNEYLTYLLTPTKEKEEHLILANAFKIPLRKLLSFGYPRNDILLTKNKQFTDHLKDKFEIASSIKRIILYAPTFRDDYVFRFPLTKSEMESLNDFLKITDTVFLIKGHIFEEKIDVRKYKHFHLVGKNTDIQELLLISDILITDYSSMIFDYLLLDRPILLFAYDLNEYVNERGMYYNFEEIAPGPILLNGKELIDAIKNIENIDKKFIEKRKIINNRFNKYTDGKSIERVLKFLKISFNYK